MSFEPKRILPDDKWEHYNLYRNVREAIFSLPAQFTSATSIEGLAATDIFTLNSTLGATIEHQVVETLNRVRSVWDPQGEYRLYTFVRQSQTFPDVLLVKSSSESTFSSKNILLGVELKGWYLLAKEGEPSFRFQVSPEVCTLADMIVVVPWALSNVISGTPRVFSPYIESAKFAAEYRNYWWESLRNSKTDSKLSLAQNVEPYPRKSDRILDQPLSDQGGNFGRYSRTGIMDEYIQSVNSQLLCGIRADHWRDFFKLFQDQANQDTIRKKIEQLKKRFSTRLTFDDSQSFFDNLLALFERYAM